MKIKSYKDLHVYQMAMNGAMKIFELSKKLPLEEKYSLVDQMRRSSRSVCANTAEAWRKRRYKAAFISRLSDAECEAEETRVWLEFCLRCRYCSKNMVADLDKTYDAIIAQIVKMIIQPGKWVIE